MFDYSTLKAHISKTTNDRNAQVSDYESMYLEGSTQLRKDSSCAINIHAQRDTQKHCFIYPCTTLRLMSKCNITRIPVLMSTY